MNKPYARHATEEFNARLHTLLMRVTEDIQRTLGENLVALVLGGGYGRGEGGVVIVDGVEQPYNDLDFFLVVRRKGAVRKEALSNISRKYEAEVPVRLDFSRPLTIYDIRHWPHMLTWCDVAHGHIVLTGPPNIIRANAPPLPEDSLPPSEATRMLMVRGGGLLWAMRVVRGIEPPPDPDFVRRNYYKCALGMGDALLVLHHRFSCQYQGRDIRLRQLAQEIPAVAALRLEELYNTALKFKFRPDEVSSRLIDDAALQTLAQRWGEVFLYVENTRFGRTWPSLTEYVRWPGLREPQQHDSLRKLLRNIIRNAQNGTLSWRYPRESIYRRLPGLLGVAEVSGKDWTSESARLLVLWTHFT